MNLFLGNSLNVTFVVANHFKGSVLTSIMDTEHVQCVSPQNVGWRLRKILLL